MSGKLQKPLIFTESGEPVLDYEVLTAICQLPARERASTIARRAYEIEAVIAEVAMGWRRGWEGASWFKGADEEGFQCFANNYAPMRHAPQALAAMDAMIARGWGFNPKWNGLDFSAVDAFHLEKRLHVRALYWGTGSERHATALSLTVALACLLEKEMEGK